MRPGPCDLVMRPTLALTYPGPSQWQPALHSNIIKLGFVTKHINIEEYVLAGILMEVTEIIRIMMDDRLVLRFCNLTYSQEPIFGS